MISNTQNNVSFGKLKIADMATKERLEETMKNPELKLAVKEGLAAIDRVSGEDLVILSSETQAQQLPDGPVCGCRGGYRLFLKSGDGTEIDRGFIPTEHKPFVNDLVSTFSNLLAGVQEAKKMNIFENSDLDMYM